MLDGRNLLNMEVAGAGCHSGSNKDSETEEDACEEENDDNFGLTRYIEVTQADWQENCATPIAVQFRSDKLALIKPYYKYINNM